MGNCECNNVSSFLFLANRSRCKGGENSVDSETQIHRGVPILRGKLQYSVTVFGIHGRGNYYILSDLLMVL